MSFVDELPRTLQRSAATVYMKYDVLCAMCACMRTYGRTCHVCVHFARVCHAIMGIIARAALSFEGERARIVFSLCVERESVPFILLYQVLCCIDQRVARKRRDHCFIQQEKWRRIREVDVGTAPFLTRRVYS